MSPDEDMPAFGSQTEDAGVESEEGWDDHDPVDGGRAESVLSFLARQIVDDTDSISIGASETRHGVKLSLRVAPDDMGKVIGRRGRVAQSIRSVVRAAGVKDGVDVIIDIVD
ncbi:MAG: KH domain-containing protein [Acidimicrobiales bacterium]